MISISSKHLNLSEELDEISCPFSVDTHVRWNFYSWWASKQKMQLSFWYETQFFLSTRYHVLVIVVWSLSHVWLFMTPWTVACQAPLSSNISPSLLKFISTELVAAQPSHPLSPLSPPALKLSQHQGLFQWVSTLQQVAKELELQLQHQFFQWILWADFL